MKSNNPWSVYKEERVSSFHRYKVSLEFIPEMKECIKAYAHLRDLGLIHCTDGVPRSQNIFLEVVCSPDILGRIVQTLHSEFGCWISTKEV